MDEVQRVLLSIPTAVIFIGQSGLGPWETQEVRVVLNQQAKRGLRVIPILLPGAPDLSTSQFLGQFTWSDFRKGARRAGLVRLEAGIRKGLGQTLPAQRAKSSGPKIHNLPYQQLGEYFKGRTQELALLATRLSKKGRSSAIVQTQAIHGLGGIGKTRMAVEYAWRYGDRYAAVFFVVADSVSSLRSSLAQLARDPYFDMPPGEGATEAQQVEAVLLHLRSNSGWLLIFDNVDSTEAAQAVCEMLPLLSQGHSIVTSRRRDWPASLKQQPLDVLSRDEAVSFLLERTLGGRSESTGDPPLAAQLADLLGCLPLALEQAAANIAHRHISFDQYLSDWRRNREKALSWYDRTLMQYPRSLAATWQATLEHLSSNARATMSLLAYLAPDPIPQEPLEKAGSAFQRACALIGAGAPQEEEDDIHNALVELAAYSMLTLRRGTVTVHRLVQEVFRHWQGGPQAANWVAVALELLVACVPRSGEDVESWPAWESLRPHLAKVLTEAEALALEQPTASLMISLAIFLRAQGLYGEAESLNRRALAIAERSEDRQLKANIPLFLNNLAECLEDADRKDEAEGLIRRALDLESRASDPEHPRIAVHLNNLAQIVRSSPDRLVEAESLLRRALAISRKTFGDEHPQTALHMANLGALLKERKSFVEAEVLLRGALDVDRKALGSGNPEVATDLNNLAAFLRDCGRTAEAEQLQRQALEIDAKAFGTEHPSVARDLKNLGNLLRAKGRFLEAQAALEKAVAILQTRLGSGHSKTLDALHDLEELKEELGRSASPAPQYLPFGSREL